MTLINHVAVASGDQVNATTAAIDTRGATFLVMVVSDTDAVNGVVPADTKSNTWLKAVSTRFSGNSSVAIWYVLTPVVDAAHVFSVSGQGAVFPSIMVGAFSGLNAVLDKTNSGGATGTSAACGSVTPAFNNELIITGTSCWGASVPAQPTSIDSGQTIVDTVALNLIGGVAQAYGGGLAYEIQNATTTRNPTWTCTNTTTNIATVIATFSAAVTKGTGYYHDVVALGTRTVNVVI